MEHRDVRELSEDVDGMYEMSCPGHQKKTKRVLGNKKHMRLKILIWQVWEWTRIYTIYDIE